MLRALIDSPQRFLQFLRATEEGREIVPDDLYEIWQVVDAAVGRTTKVNG